MNELMLNNNKLLSISSVVFILLILVGGVSAQSQQPPNIILINADDLGYGDLSSYGASLLNTPNIDRLAKEGRRFTDAHSASAVCTPSRYALLTGEYPIRHGNLNAPVFLKSKLVIDTQKETIASLLKKAGYSTACIGKWHLGFGETEPVDWNKPLTPGPNELGFDYYYGVPVVNSHPPFVYVENHHVVGFVEDDPFIYGKKAKTQEVFEKMKLDAIGGADKAHGLYIDEQVGTRLTEKALSWMKQQIDKPFFLYLATTNIHHPFTPAPQFVGTSNCGIYGDFVHELDWIVGEVMKTVKEMGEDENTLVIFTSDNGGMFNATGQRTWQQGHKPNGELLGFKFDVWEGGHRVPFIAHWPGKIKAGEVSGQLICNVDMLSTFSALTGQQFDENQGRDSIDMLDVILGNTDAQIREEVLLAPLKKSHLSVRKGKWMFIGARGAGGFSSGKYGAHAFGGPKAIEFAGQINSDIENGKIKKDAPPAQLYDLENDPHQTTNVYNKFPEIAIGMEELLKSYKN
ncbi:sulfatase family protein [Maribacter polysaccharolyticus]|uniref:sulfatase family protein n=1 Tax=Maribacter polysaccharolyticus TaxID=3020831 RepID=UPI00237FC15D|nr:arylsulfatase [Maribacter polysaccharolyticus]MDE3742073.1 arylsulfatase [Maribacter polysaccharolyticus]